MCVHLKHFNGGVRRQVANEQLERSLEISKPGFDITALQNTQKYSLQRRLE
jgi:hypothetical protein